MGYIEVVERTTTRARIADVAEEQWGLVTRRQLELAHIPATTVERIVAPGGTLERVARGVYRLAGTPTPDHIELRAAWLQLAPGVEARERLPADGVVSHRSAASLYGIGHLPADRHEFIVQHRKQSRRPDVRLHRRSLDAAGWIRLSGLPVTRPSRIASDLLYDHEDPEAVAQIVADALRRVSDYPGTFVEALAPHAARFGLRRDDGLALLRWLLDLVGDDDTTRWMELARASMPRHQAQKAPAAAVSHPAAPHR